MQQAYSHQYEYPESADSDREDVDIDEHAESNNDAPVSDCD